MKRTQRLKDSLRILSLNPELQLKYLDEHSTCPMVIVDELALDYDAIAAAAGDMLFCEEVTQRQHDFVKELNEYLGKMSGPEKSHLWTKGALKNSPEWEEVRKIAQQCLAEL